MKNDPWQAWLAYFNSIIDSENPRRVGPSLSSVTSSMPHSEGSLENLKDTFTAIVRLRESKCYGRFDHEASLMKRIAWWVQKMLYKSVLSDRQRDLFEEPQDEKLSAEEIEKLKVIASYSIDALTTRLKKDDKKYLRVAGAFEILEELVDTPECNEYTKQAEHLATKIIKQNSIKMAVSAAQYIAHYHSYEKDNIPPEVISSMKALEEDCEDEDTVRSLNIILVELGVIDPLSAMDRMDDF